MQPRNRYSILVWSINIMKAVPLNFIDNIPNFLQYGKNFNAAIRLVDSFTFRLNECNLFLHLRGLDTIRHLYYLHLTQFIVDLNHSSPMLKKLILEG